MECLVIQSGPQSNAKRVLLDAKRANCLQDWLVKYPLRHGEGGSDLDANFKLRLAVDRARKENMPKENIDRAIKRGPGEDKSGENIERVTYEGYAAHGVSGDD